MSRFRPRKRDQLLEIFRQTPQSPAAPASQSNGPSPPITHSQVLFDKALHTLSTSQQTTVRLYLISGPQNVQTAVHEAYRAAEHQKRLCEGKRWRWTFRGREVVLRDKADKVLAWLERFKSVGDIVANVDPLHAGLPWAGIRIILEVSISERRQMAALMIGMDLALGMINRLKVYLEYFEQLPSTFASTNFEKALVNIYAHTLRFLANAIEAYQKNTFTRSWQAIWQASDLEDFEVGSDKLASRAEIEASNCDRNLDEARWKSARQWKQNLEANLRKLDDIQALQDSVDNLHLKVDLTKLVTAEGAMYNSYADENLQQCLPGTRTQLLSQITSWAADSNGKGIYWLCGMAGTGKSTISRTVSHKLDQQGSLGASFFFKRGEGDRGNARRFFPTVSAQLVNVIPSLSQYIAEALAADTSLCEKNLQEQFEKLLWQPLEQATTGRSLLSSLVLVIDALDECDRPADVGAILRYLSRLHALSHLRLRVLVTSRPDLPIQLGFKNIHGDLREEIILEEVQALTIEQDIRKYFTHQLDMIKKDDQSTNVYDPLPDDWPKNDSIEALVSLAVPLFIFASTVCRFISESDPKQRLETILQQRQYSSVLGLEPTYKPVLDHLIANQDPQQQEQTVSDFQELVGSIVLLADPLSASSLSELLQVSSREIGNRLKKLRPVLNIPAAGDVPIRLLHLSFREFLINPSGRDTNRFWVDEIRTHVRLTERCLQRLSRPRGLRKDSLSLEKPGARRADINKRRVSQAITNDIAYACCHWTWHLTESRQEICDGGLVHQFLERHLLHWLEALSWLGRLSRAVTYLSDLRAIVKVEEGTQLKAFLYDAWRFLLRYRYVIDLAPLQLYCSALVFSPNQSIIRNTFQEELSQKIEHLIDVPPSWNAEIFKIETDCRKVLALAFSPDGQTIASGSHDGIVRLCSAATGEVIQELKHDDAVQDLAFYSDGLAIATASRDCTVRLWNAVTGEETQRLKYNGLTTSVALSPDGQTTVSASEDGTVKLWNTMTGEEMQKFKHDTRVHVIASSANGEFVASVSDLRTIRIWNATTGEGTQRLEHDKTVSAVVFSPDGETVAVMSVDDTARLWNAKTGKMMQKLGQEIVTHAIHFSKDQRFIASGSDDETVRLWNARTGEQIQVLEGHEYSVHAVAFSPDGQFVVSGSLDETVRLWDAAASEERQVRLGELERPISHGKFSPGGQIVALALWDKTILLKNLITGKEMQKLKGHKGTVTSIDFSPDGQVLASSSANDAIRLWNTSTGEEMGKLGGHSSVVLGLAFSPDGLILGSGSADGEMWLWNTVTWESIRKLDSRSKSVTGLAFSPDGQHLASIAGADFTNFSVRLWNIATGLQTQKLEGHRNDLTAVAFSPDGQIVASADTGATVCLWNAMTGEQIRRFQDEEFTYSLAFSEDGQYLLTDLGRLDLHSDDSLFTVSGPDPSRLLTVCDQWIRYGGEDILWLPYEHRGLVTARGSGLVIGQRSGAVDSFRAV